MTMTCPEQVAPAASRPDTELDAEMLAAAHCGSVLEDVGLRLAFVDHPDRPLTILLERPAGEPLRRLSVGELLALIALAPAQLRAWARQPELPIPGRARR